MNKIKSYYRLCAIASKDKQLKPFVNMLDVKVVESILSKEQRKILFVEDEEYFRFEESVIGGERPQVTMGRAESPIHCLRAGGENKTNSDEDVLISELIIDINTPDTMSCNYCGGKRKSKKVKNKTMKSIQLPLSALDKFNIIIV